MSPEAQIAEQEIERAERPVLRRTFDAQLTPAEGRTIDVRIVPYGERIEHNDGYGGSARGVMYREEWMPGAFDDQIRGALAGRAREVYVNFEHEEGLGGVFGHGIMLREGADAFYGTFEILDTSKGDTALALIRAGGLSGVSVEALGKKSVRGTDGVIRRVKAHLRAIALCRKPAYASARILALREEQDDLKQIFIDEELLPVDMDPQMLERCRHLGVALPARYEAHPADTGTPAETGTPEDGTRQADPTTSSEES